MGYLIDLHTSAEWRSEHEDDHLHLDEVQEATELYLRIVQEYLGKTCLTLCSNCATRSTGKPHLLVNIINVCSRRR